MAPRAEASSSFQSFENNILRTIEHIDGTMHGILSHPANPKALSGVAQQLQISHKCVDVEGPFGTGIFKDSIAVQCYPKFLLLDNLKRNLTGLKVVQSCVLAIKRSPTAKAVLLFGDLLEFSDFEDSFDIRKFENIEMNVLLKKFLHFLELVQ